MSYINMNYIILTVITEFKDLEIADSHVRHRVSETVQDTTLLLQTTTKK